MVSKAVFLDRDGTINVDRGYVHRVEDFEYLPGVKEGMRLLSEAGYKLVVVTNQSGIARGYFTEEEYKELEDWMISDLAKSGIPVAVVYHCPHHPDYTGECNCRKPATGLFVRAAREFDIDLDASWAVGDSSRDLCICGTTRCRGVLLERNCMDDRDAVDGLFGAARIILSCDAGSVSAVEQDCGD